MIPEYEAHRPDPVRDLKSPGVFSMDLPGIYYPSNSFVTLTHIFSHTGDNPAEENNHAHVIRSVSNSFNVYRNSYHGHRDAVSV